MPLTGLRASDGVKYSPLFGTPQAKAPAPPLHTNVLADWWSGRSACFGAKRHLIHTFSAIGTGYSNLRNHPLGLVFVALVLFVALALPASAADGWPQFRGNPRLTGVATSTLPATLKLLWTYEAGDAIESSAAISEGAVYVGAQTGELISVDLQTGKLRWKYKATGGIGESSPAVSNGVVYVGDLNGVVHAVNAKDGKGIWTFKTASEVKSSPVVSGDRVLIGSYDSSLYGLNARTGKEEWKVTTGGYVHATPVIADGLTYIAGCDEVFRAIRVTDGEEMFQVAAGAYAGASPAMPASIAYFGTFSNEVIGLDAAKKTVLWRYEHEVRHFPFYSSAAVLNGKVVVGGRDKFVHCLDAKTGKALWTFTTKARIDSSPAISGDRVYIGSNDGKLYVLALATGAKLWEFEAGSPLSASPAIADGRLVIGSQDGRLYCFGAGN